MSESVDSMERRIHTAACHVASRGYGKFPASMRLNDNKYMSLLRDLSERYPYMGLMTDGFELMGIFIWRRPRNFQPDWLYVGRLFEALTIEICNAVPAKSQRRRLFEAIAILRNNVEGRPARLASIHAIRQQIEGAKP